MTEPVEPTAEDRKLSARVAVRCSAWLGVRLAWESASEKKLKTLGLAGDGRVTGDEKLASSGRMEVRKDKNGGCVERRNGTGDEKVELVGVTAKPRGSGAELATDVERKAWSGKNARNSEQAGKRRGIGKPRVR